MLPERQTSMTSNQFRLSNEFAINSSTLRRLHWGRAVAGGVCAELAVFAIVFPILHFFGQTAFLASILVSSPFFRSSLPCGSIDMSSLISCCTDCSSVPSPRWCT